MMKAMKGIFLAGTLGLLFTFGLMGAAPAPPEVVGDITVTGSTTVLPIVAIAAEEYIRKHPGARISVRGGGSGVGIAALTDKVTDIAMSSRPIREAEIETARARGVNPVEHMIANDGIAVIVHPLNPVNELSLAQLREIYTGRITNWTQVGGEPGEIVVVSRDVASGTFKVFNRFVLKDEKVWPGALLQASNTAVLITTKITPGAIGYIGLGYIGPDIKVLALDGVKPTIETVLAGTYPITRPLFLYTDGEPEGLSKSFIDFILGDEGQRLIKEEGFGPIR